MKLSRTTRLFVSLTLILLIGMNLIGLTPTVHAQGPGPQVFSCDLTTLSGNACSYYTITDGTWVSGQGVTSVAGASEFIMMDVNLTGGAQTIYHAEVQTCFDISPTGGGAGSADLITLSGVTQATIDLADVYSGCVNHTWDGSVSADYLVMNPSGNCGSTQCIQIKSYEFTILGTVTPTPSPSPTATNTPVGTPVPGACGSSWTITDDFRTGDFGWTGSLGNLRDSSGFHSAALLNMDATFSQALLVGKTLASGTLTSVTIDFDYVQGKAGTSDIRAIQVQLDSTTLIDDTHPPATGSRQLTWTGTASAGVMSISMYASGEVATRAEADGSATLNSIKLTGTGLSPNGDCIPTNPNPSSASWAFPVSSNDRAGGAALQSLASDSFTSSPESPFVYLEQDIPGGTYDHSKAATLLLASGEGKYVHSATDGTVSAVTGLNADNPCVTFDISVLAGLTSIPSYTCVFTVGGAIEALDYHNASVVSITTGLDIITYIVDSAKVAVGDSVSKGCILGLTLPFYTLKGNLGIGSATGAWEKSQDGYTITQGRAGGLPFDVIPQFVEQPQDLTCGTAGGGAGTTGGCKLVKNSLFSPVNDGNWIGDSLTSPNGSGQGLWLQSEVHQNLPLIAGASYTIEVVAHLINAADGTGGGSGVAPFGVMGMPFDFTINIGGGTPTQVQVTDTSPQTMEIASAVYPPGPNNTFQLSIAPTDNTRGNVSVDYVCVNDAVTDPPLASECILLNPYFDSGQGWTTSGTVSFDQPGMVEITDGGSISQDVTLSPKVGGGSETYYLTVEARRKGAAETGHSVTLDWDIASQSGTFGPYSDQLGWHIANDTFDIATKSTFTLTLTGASTPSGDVVQVQSVCLTTLDGSPPPGYQPPLPFTASCRVCSYAPVGDITVDLPEVIAWLFCALSQIWQCQAKQILMGIWTALVNILTFIGFARLWMAYTYDGMVKWLLADWQVFARWLNGEFQNIISRIVPQTVDAGSHSTLGDILMAIIQGLTSTINNLLNQMGQTARDLLAFLTHFLDVLLKLALSLINAVLSIIGFIVSFLQFLISQIIDFLRTLLAIITNAVNAPPSLPAGMPICDTSASEIPESCVGIFMLDHTVFDPSSPFSFFIPLIEGLVGFAAIWWAINKFRRALAGEAEE